jgi:hypothetical protein
MCELPAAVPPHLHRSSSAARQALLGDAAGFSTERPWPAYLPQFDDVPSAANRAAAAAAAAASAIGIQRRVQPQVHPPHPNSSPAAHLPASISFQPFTCRCAAPVQLQRLQLPIDRAASYYSGSSSSSAHLLPVPSASAASLPLLLTAPCASPHSPADANPTRTLCIASQVTWGHHDATRCLAVDVQLPPCTPHAPQLHRLKLSVPIPPPSPSTAQTKRVQTETVGRGQLVGSVYVAAFDRADGEQCECPSDASAPAAHQEPCAEVDAPLLWHEHVTLASAAQAAATYVPPLPLISHHHACSPDAAAAVSRATP